MENATADIPEGDGASPRPAYPIESVDNALRLLLMFREQPAIRVAEASRSIGVARSTAHRLLAMLQFHGFVTRDEDTRGYRAGPALLDVGLAVIRDMDVRGAARPALEALAADVGETVHLAVLEGADILFVDSVESAHIVRVGSRVGARLSAHLTSPGKAMLAALPPERVAALYAKETLPGTTTSSIVRRRDLFAELERVAAAGYATNEGESEADVGAVGMAVVVGGSVRAAISVSAPLARFDRALVDRVVPRLRAAVAQVVDALA